MRCVLCDDQPMSAQRFMDLLHDFLRVNTAQYELDVYADAYALITDLRAGKRYDIYYIDIDMPIGGEDVVNGIHRMHRDALCVFLSNYPDKGYIACRAGLDSYIYKSMSDDSIKSELARILELYRNRNLTYAFTVPGGRCKVQVRNIEYIEAVKRHVIVHLIDGDAIEVTGYTLTALQEVHELHELIRVSRSYLINLDHVELCTKTHITMACGLEMRIAKDMRDEVVRRIMDYMHKKSGAK